MLVSIHTSPVNMPQSLLVSHKPSGMFGLNLSVWSLALTSHAAIPVLMEDSWSSLQALGPSLSKGARPSW